MHLTERLDRLEDALIDIAIVVSQGHLDHLDLRPGRVERAVALWSLRPTSEKTERAWKPPSGGA